MSSNEARAIRPIEGLPERVEARALLEIALNARIRFGRYELLARLPGLGAAAVYEARDTRRADGAIVALKRLESPRSGADKKRFEEEVRLTTSLGAHANIVRVIDSGQIDGVPYYTMPFAEGGTLVDWYLRRPRTPEALASVMARVARAVGRAHVHAGVVLHRDLKPTNILMDATGEPSVADFGIATRLEGDEPGTGRALVGTLDYMAPEQALGDPEKLTPAADIYSLGVVLYELLTGWVPVPGACVGEFLQRLWSAEPIVPPRKLVPGVHRGLESICLLCLENVPRRRYSSAEALAEDFERVRDGKPPRARPPSRLLRTARWVRRHPRTSYAATAALAVLTIAGIALSALAHEREREQDRILAGNASIASGQAGAALFQLREYSDHLVDLARQPAVQKILARGRPGRPAPELEPLVGGFDGVMVVGLDGYILGQWPSRASFIYQRNYDFRDYVRGARRLAETRTPGVYVARAFRSESTDMLEFGISTTVCDGKGAATGFVVGVLSTKSVFGAVRMEELPRGRETERIITALIGPRGNDRERGPDAPAPSDFSFLVHPCMNTGGEYPVRAPTPAALKDRFGMSAAPGHQLSLQYGPAMQLDDHRDPIPGFAGEWLAALAPVGKTGFLVLVETPKPPALPWTRWGRQVSASLLSATAAVARLWQALSVSG